MHTAPRLVIEGPCDERVSHDENMRRGEGRHEASEYLERLWGTGCWDDGDEL